jgi:hypothetical protein
VTTPTDTLQSQPAPITATFSQVKPRRSNKAPAVKAAVLISRANGKAKREISRDLGISRPTVDVIIKEADLDRTLASGKLSCATLIPKAIDAIEKTLVKGDGELGRKFLNDMGVIGENAKNSPGPEQIHLSQAINIMFKQQSPQTQADTTQPVIEVNTAPADK